MSSYTQEQIKDLWDFFDEDKSGKIPCAELKNLFLKLGSDSETAEMKAEVSLMFIVSSFYLDQQNHMNGEQKSLHTRAILISQLTIQIISINDRMISYFDLGLDRGRNWKW